MAFHRAHLLPYKPWLYNSEMCVHSDSSLEVLFFPAERYFGNIQLQMEYQDKDQVQLHIVLPTDASVNPS